MTGFSGRVAAGLVVPLLVLGGCSGGGASTGAGPEEPTREEVPTGMVLVETEIGSVARPDTWEPAPDAESVGQQASFVITDDTGETVGQMDVILNTVTPGTAADAVAAAADSARGPNLPSLRHTSRDFTDVPGADSAFVTESTYTTTGTEEPAISLDQVAVTEDGDYMLVRITAAEEAYDPELSQSVVDTMRLTGESS